MSVEATLIIARQMYEVACLPRMPEAETGLPALIEATRMHCNHPDSRVRRHGCKTLCTIAKGYTDLMVSYQLDWVVSLQKTMSNGLNDGDVDNAAVLKDAMHALGVSENQRTPFASPLSPTPEPEDHKEADYLDDQVDHSVPTYIAEDRRRSTRLSTVLLRVSSDDRSELPEYDALAIQNKLVTVQGVVSAFFNAEYLVLSVQGCWKKDAAFLAEISGVVSDATNGQFKCSMTDEEKAAVESTKAGSDAADTSYLDDDDRLAVRAGIKGALASSVPQVSSFFSAASTHAVNGLNLAVSYARDQELIEYHKENRAVAKEQVKQEETKKKISFFKRWFGRG